MTTKVEAPAVLQAANILKLLGKPKYANSTLTQISDALEINRSTCLRILKTLREVNFINFDAERKTYSLGPYLVILGSKAYEQIDYLAISRTFLKRLVDETSLTSALVHRISPDRLAYVSKEDSQDVHAVNISVGHQFPITEISYGMWYLAYMDEDERNEYLKKGLKPITKHTITDIDLYLKKMNQAKKDGYLCSINEYVEGICGFSAPIFNPNGEIAAVIACVGFSTVSEEQIETTLKSIKSVAEDFTALLSMKQK